MAGRALNRPRDRTGRPLAPGATGVAAVPVGVGDRTVRGADEVLAAAQRYLDADRPFAAHEVFEQAWKTGPLEEREWWRALAQLAVGLTHRQRGNPVGEQALLERAAAGLARVGWPRAAQVVAAARSGARVRLR